MLESYQTIEPMLANALKHHELRDLPKRSPARIITANESINEDFTKLIQAWAHDPQLVECGLDQLALEAAMAFRMESLFALEMEKSTRLEACREQYGDETTNASQKMEESFKAKVIKNIKGSREFGSDVKVPCHLWPLARFEAAALRENLQEKSSEAQLDHTMATLSMPRPVQAASGGSLSSATAEGAGKPGAPLVTIKKSAGGVAALMGTALPVATCGLIPTGRFRSSWFEPSGLKLRASSPRAEPTEPRSLYGRGALPSFFREARAGGKGLVLTAVAVER